ncbi:MAG: FHA domain-containing protein [Bacteroidales bacterium]|nr:FHA domain-containing protein [Bacteroidales bacterium]
MDILVGRSGNQKLTITDKSVSREHCRLTLMENGNYTLENLSANGTFVNEKDVIKTVVTPETQIRLGTRFVCLVKDLLPSNESDEQPKVNTTDSYDLFIGLEKVYENYIQEKIRIQQEASKANFMRTIPGMITGGVFAITMVLGSSPAVNFFRIITGLGAVILIAYSASKAYKAQNDTPEKIEALNRKFQTDYVCPICGNFLGFLPFELLKKRNQCSYCKKQWVK